MASQNKIIRNPDNTFYWRCKTEREYQNNSLKFTFKVTSLISLFVLLYGGYLSYTFHSPESMIIVTGCVVAFMAIVILILLLSYKLNGDFYQSYLLTETYVRAGEGRYSSIFKYKKARTFIVSRKYVQLNGRFVKFMIYVPEENLSFVKNYIMRRLPGTTLIRYQDF